MKIKLVAIAFVVLAFSCNTGDNKTSGSTGNETGQSANTDAQKKQLNDQSRACISLMNSLEEQLNAANASHNAQAAASIQSRIDSAAEENVKIGQKLMALEK